MNDRPVFTRAAAILAVVASCAVCSAQSVVVGPDMFATKLVVYHFHSSSDEYEIVPFPKGFTGGVRVAVGDVDGDAVADDVLAQGPGGTNLVRIFDGASRSYLSTFQAFPVPAGSKALGCNVAVLVGPTEFGSANEIVAGQDAGGLPQVNVFDVKGNLVSSFLAFDKSFTGGVRVATGDVNGDGIEDIVAGAGPGGLPEVRVFDGKSGAIIMDFAAFDKGFSGGVYVSAADVNGDGLADIVVGTGGGSAPDVEVIDARTVQPVIHASLGYGSGLLAVHVAAADLNGDGYADIVVGPGVGGNSQVEVFDGKTGALAGTFTAFPAWNQGGGVWVAASAK